MPLPLAADGVKGSSGRAGAERMACPMRTDTVLLWGRLLVVERGPALKRGPVPVKRNEGSESNGL